MSESDGRIEICAVRERTEGIVNFFLNDKPKNEKRKTFPFDKLIEMYKKRKIKKKKSKKNN